MLADNDKGPSLEASSYSDPNLAFNLNIHDGAQEEPDYDDTRALFKAWVNERMAPTILPYAHDTVSNIVELVKNQSALLDEQQKDTSHAAYINSIYDLEIERLRWLLSSYLRCRLTKLENFWQHWIGLKAEDRLQILSSGEEEYLQRFSRLMMQTLDDTVLKNLPPAIAQLPTDNIPRPTSQKHVVCKVLEDLGPVQVDSA